MDVTTNRTAEDERKARESEYGTYTASEAIHIDGALAFNAGDPVPVSHVQKYNLGPAVQKVAASKSAADAKGADAK